MLTDRTQALLAAIEHQVEASQAALASQQERVRALEIENLALKERLLALAELDPALTGSGSHTEDPDGGSRARGLGNLAFRRPKPKSDSGDAETPRRTPLQRLTSATESAPTLAAREEAEIDEGQKPEGLQDSPAPTSPQGDDDFDPDPKGGVEDVLGDDDALSPQALLAQWYKRYPQTFFKGHTRPLKTGIHLDLCELEPWPEKLVRRALACYVHLPRYLKSVREGVQRVDLAGEESDVVATEEAKHAKRQLEALQKKQRVRQDERQTENLDRKIGALLAKHGQNQS